MTVYNNNNKNVPMLYCFYLPKISLQQDMLILHCFGFIHSRYIFYVSCFYPSHLDKRAVPLQSVESKLGRTGESELAERETGERREEEESQRSMWF